MDIASAYPDSALPAWQLVILAVVMAVSLGLWLILVFRAEKSSATGTRQADSRLSVAEPDETAEDRDSGTSRVPAGRSRGAAA